MLNCIGIRKENKDLTEKRVALTPAHVKQLTEQGIRVYVEPSDTRIFADSEYEKAGALLTTDLSDANIIFGVKEIPVANLAPGKTYCFFSHTIKGQSYNMPMLAHILQNKITLFDYELVTSDAGRRLIFFGNFAGYAGMIDSLWALGKRLEWEGIATPFSEIQPAHQYANLREAEAAIRDVGSQIQRQGLPAEITPLVVGFSGYGQVAKGAQHIYDLLPTVSVTPEELTNFVASGNYSQQSVYKVEFHEKHMFSRADGTTEFELQDYFNNPQHYIGNFERFIPSLTVLMNCIYWEPTCPRLLTKPYLKSAYASGKRQRLRVVGDISCDIDGSIEMTVKATNSLNPIYVYDPLTDSVTDGYQGPGPVIMAVDKLPAELPREASHAFGDNLLPFVATLAKLDFTRKFEALDTMPELSGSIIAHQGELTPEFKHLSAYLH